MEKMSTLLKWTHEFNSKVKLISFFLLENELTKNLVLMHLI